MIQKMHYFLMISCPSDVVEERKLLQECVDIINREREDNVWVELSHWITDTSSDASMPAQESINNQMVKESDGLIAIFNARLGTPVHIYRCGTEEEIDLMLKAGKHVSLLFNTKPRIDLTKPKSIEQISALQEYKMEQSGKAYYKEFDSDESFKTLALHEIRMWLRKIKSSQDNKQEIKIDDGELVESKDNENNDDVLNPQPESSKIDVEAGQLDCVVYLIDLANELTTITKEYSDEMTEYNSKTDKFAEEFSFLNKQKNANAQVVLCKKYSQDTNNFANYVKGFSEKFSIKWGNINSYLIRLSGSIISNEDKIIMKNSISRLRIQFDLAKNSTNTIIDALSLVPNIQKDVFMSARNLKNEFVKYISILNNTLENCEELERIWS